MSRSLPERPNLDHLKHQAKDLLRELQTRAPDTQLADALHALAREYGFRTWPELKEHVTALPRISPFAGRWTANVAKSQRHPANQFELATIEFAVTGTLVTMTSCFLAPWGKEERSTITIEADGVPHAKSGDRLSVMARWRGAHRLEAFALRDGEEDGAVTYEVSADGTTLTITSSEQVIVLER
jgi:hypothetical protein